MKDKIDNIKNLAKNFTIETTPKVYKKISKLSFVFQINIFALKIAILTKM